MNYFSVHKIFPHGMKVFQCSVKSCTFVSGNQIIFNRHRHSSQPKGANKNIKLRSKCSVCSKYFVNNSSLKRHVKNVHN